MPPSQTGKDFVSENSRVQGWGTFLQAAAQREGPWLRGARGPGGPLPAPWRAPAAGLGLGSAPAGCFLRLRPQRLGAALIGVLEACRLVSLGLTIVLGVKGLGVVSLAWDFCTPHLLSSVQKL